MLSSGNSKRPKYANGILSTEAMNEEYCISQGKCSSCNTIGSPIYSCLKCDKLFHEHCDNFRIDRDSTGICGSCLISVRNMIFIMFLNFTFGLTFPLSLCRFFLNVRVVIVETSRVFMDWELTLEDIVKNNTIKTGDNISKTFLPNLMSSWIPFQTKIYQQFP